MDENARVHCIFSVTDEFGNRTYVEQDITLASFEFESPFEIIVDNFKRFLIDAGYHLRRLRNTILQQELLKFMQMMNHMLEDLLCKSLIRLLTIRSL